MLAIVFLFHPDYPVTGVPDFYPVTGIKGAYSWKISVNRKFSRG